MTSIDNGIGSRTTITYQPSSYFWTSTDTRWNLPFITQAVSSISTCSILSGTSCIGNTYTTNYSYSGAYYNAGAREFRDFYSVSATTIHYYSSYNVTTQTLYHQGNGNIDTGNNVITATADNAADSVGYLAGQPFQVTVTDSNGTVRSKTTLTYWPDVDSAPPFFAPIKQVDNFFYESPSVYKISRTLNTFDDRYSNYSGVFGNLTKEETWFDLADNPSDYKQVQRGFKPNISLWLVGLPSYEKVFDTTNASTLKGLTVYHYDGATGQAMPTLAGNLTQIGRWYDRGTGTGCDGLVSSGSCFVTSMVYDGYGNVTSITDAKSHMTSNCYDATGTFPQKVTNAKSQVVLTDYYGVAWNSACGSAPPAYTGSGLYGQIKSVTDPNSQQTTTAYDTLGRKISVNTPDGASTTWLYPCSTSTNCTPDANNYFGNATKQYVKINTTIGLSSWTYFDGLGRTTSEKKSGADGNIIRVDTYYNDLGKISSVMLPYFDGSANNGGTGYSYDIIGRLNQIGYADGTRTLLCPNLWDVATIDPNNHLKRERKDGHGRIKYVDEYKSSYTACPAPSSYPAAYATTQYQYDVFGNLTSTIDGAGNVNSIYYDSLSRKYSMSDMDMGTWSYVYDSVGNLTQQTDAKGQNLFFQYDEINRLLQKDYGTQKALGSGDVQYSYDSSTVFTAPTYFEVGRLTQVVDAAETSRFGYDKMGRISRTDKIVDGVTYTTQTGYDLGGRVKSVSYPDGDIVTYDYNGPALRYVYKDVNGNSIYDGTDSAYAQYSGYNEMVQPGTTTFGNGVTTTFSYNRPSNTDCQAQNFRICRIKTVMGPSTYQNVTYGYDGVGNITTINDFVAPSALHLNPTGQLFFGGYDELNRLTIANVVAGSLTFDYSPTGNMVCNSFFMSPCSASSPSSTYSDTNHQHAITNAGGSSFYNFSYDANGNMITRTYVGGGTTTNLSYDTENRLISYATATSTTSFVYDGDGGRVKKISGSTTSIYIGKLFECVASCYNASTGVWTNGTKHIFAGSARIASKPITTTGDIYYYHVDHEQSTSLISDKNGADAGEFFYYPFGNLYRKTGMDTNYKFTGQQNDAETNLNFYNSRYYDTWLGRFIQPDSIVPSMHDPQTLNRYSYVENNPLTYIDPTGHRHHHHLRIHISKHLKHVLKSVGWVLNPGTMAYIDPHTRPIAISATVAFVLSGGNPAAAIAAGASTAALKTGEGKKITNDVAKEVFDNVLGIDNPKYSHMLAYMALNSAMTAGITASYNSFAETPEATIGPEIKDINDPKYADLMAHQGVGGYTTGGGDR